MDPIALNEEAVVRTSIRLILGVLGFGTHEMLRLYSFVDEIRVGRAKFSRAYFFYMSAFSVGIAAAVVVYMEGLDLPGELTAYVLGLSFPSVVTVMRSSVRGKNIVLDDLRLERRDSGLRSGESEPFEDRGVLDLGSWRAFFVVGRLTAPRW